MLFFELLQVAVGRRERLSLTPSRSEWQHLYQLSEQHAMQGVCYSAVLRLPRDQWPCEEDLIDWIWQAQRIAEQNELITQRSVEACERLRSDGFDVCLLKGQGNARLYGDLGQYRQSGDVDLWCVPHDRPEHHPKRRVIEYVRRRCGSTTLRYHHIDFPTFSDAEVELHFLPIYLNNPWLNRQLGRWYSEHRDEQMQHHVTIGGGEVAVPTRSFNLLYQLLHVYKHVFEEGVGLRQMMDYYMVLTDHAQRGKTGAAEGPRTGAGEGPKAGAAEGPRTGTTEGLRMGAVEASEAEMIRELHLERLAGAVSYVMLTVFGMREEELPWPASRRQGIALLSEIMQTGNFGQFDTRYDKEASPTGTRSMLHRYWRKTKRNLALAIDFPHEGLWEPWFRLYHFFWRTFDFWKI